MYSLPTKEVTFHVPIARLDSRGSPLLLAVTWYTLHPNPTAPLVGGGPAGGWFRVPFSGCARPGPWTKVQPSDPRPQTPSYPGQWKLFTWSWTHTGHKNPVKEVKWKTVDLVLELGKWTSIAYTYMTQDGKPNKDQESQLCTKKTSYGSDLRHPFRSHWPGGQSAEQSLAWTCTEPAPRILSPLFLLLIIRLSFSLWPCHRGMWLYTIIICQSIFTVQWTADIKIYDKLILTNLCYLNVIFQPLVCTALLLLASVGF